MSFSNLRREYGKIEESTTTDITHTIFLAIASKDAPWSSSTGETVVVIEQRNAHGIQTADGWSQ